MRIHKLDCSPERRPHSEKRKVSRGRKENLSPDRKRAKSSPSSTSVPMVRTFKKDAAKKKTSRSALTPLRSPSLSITLEPVNVATNDLDGYTISNSDLFEPPRKVIISQSSTSSVLSMPSFDDLYNHVPSPLSPLPDTPTASSSSENTVASINSCEDSSVVAFSLPSTMLPSSLVLSMASPVVRSTCTVVSALPSTIMSAISSAEVHTPTSSETVSQQSGVDPFSSNPDYVLRSCEIPSFGPDPYDYLASDPRLFFAGAPSSVIDGGISSILARYRTLARQQGTRTLSHVPLGFGSIERVESVAISGVATYSLGATWTRDPHYKVKKDCYSQTPYEQSSKKQTRDIGIQCS